MITPELKDYIKAELDRGVVKEDLRGALIAAGWPADDVEQGLDPGAAKSASSPAMGSIFEASAPTSRSTSNKFQAVRDKISALIQKLTRKKDAAAQSEHSESPLGNASGLKAKLAALKEHPHFKKGLIAGLASLFLLSGSGVAAFFYLRSPDRVLAKMVDNFSNVKSLEYDGVLKASASGGALGGLSAGGFRLASPGTGGAPAIGDISVGIKGASDIIDFNNPKFKFAFSVSADGLNGGKPLGFDMLGQKSAFYFRVNNIGAVAGFDLSPLSDQWISFIDKSGASQAKESLTEEEVKSIMKLAKKAKVIRVEQELPGETVSGVETRRLKFRVDKDGLRKFIVDVNKEAYGRKVSGKKVEEFEKSLDSKPLPGGELWVGRKDSLPYKLAMNFSEKTSGNLAVVFGGFNKPVQIDAPGQSKPFQDVLMMVMSGGLKAKTDPLAAKKGEKPAKAAAAAKEAKPVPQQAKAVQPAAPASKASMEMDPSESVMGSGNPGIDTDGDGLDDEMESMLGTNPRKQDTDGDGVKDGTEVKRGEDPTSRN